MYSILFVIAGIYISVLLNAWLTVNGLFKNSFFQTNIADALNPIITIILTLVVTYFINVKFTNNSKICELFLELFNEYKKLLDELEKSFSEYIELKEKMYTKIDETKNTIDETDKIKLEKYEKELKAYCKNLSIHLNTIFKINKEIKNKIYIDETKFKNNFRNLKSNITNDPFGRKLVFEKSSLIKINNIFTNIKKDIFLQKVKFYE
ncbi:hypothetical protein [Aliarcobacter cryaerophilus]|uniref:hypothetical protein n=1 Tax=Aliarcobacter cryaerophilus TaxID=28198 RepID=UPI00112F396D|nr:hypothetical protein [Aliarcobacter cryaerophilus]